MIRIKIGVAIIIAIIVLGISGFFILKSETNEIISLIDDAQTLSNNNQKDEALEAVDKLLKEWNEFHTYASVFISNDKISVAQNSISRFKALIESDNDELNAEYDTAKSSLKWIIESEIPRVTNIL